MGTRSGGFVREGELFLPVTRAMGSDHLGSQLKGKQSGKLKRDTSLMRLS